MPVLTPFDLAAEVEALRAELEARRDPVYNEGIRRIVPTAMPSHGVRLPELRQIARDWSRRHRDLAAEDLIRLADALWRAASREEGILAMLMLSHSKAALRQLPWAFIEEWSSRFDNWEHVDQTALSLTSHMLVERPQLLPDVLTLAHSDNTWQRRLALVTLLQATRLDRAWRPQLQHAADALEGDRGPTMRKALTWARRVLNETEAALVR